LSETPEAEAPTVPFKTGSRIFTHGAHPAMTPNGLRRVNVRRTLVARRRPRISSIVQRCPRTKDAVRLFPRLNSGSSPTASEGAYRRPLRRCQTVKSAMVDNRPVPLAVQGGTVAPPPAPGRPRPAAEPPPGRPARDCIS
jgi:hypothetical protein